MPSERKIEQAQGASATLDQGNSKDRRWEQAQNCFRSGDLAGALYKHLALEREGEVASALEIARIYELGGTDISRDYVKAKLWYERALNCTGHPAAYFGLAWIYYCGLGTQKDFIKAFGYLSEIANSDQPAAHWLLGRMYEYGQGVPLDAKMAMHHYNLAATAGQYLALCNLGLLEIKAGRILDGVCQFLRGALGTITNYSNNLEPWRVNFAWKRANVDVNPFGSRGQ